MIHDYSSTSEYFSIVNPGYTEARNKNDLGNSYLITGLDFRSILNRLSSVKYIVAREGDERIIPYGYNFIKDLGQNLNLYEADTAMPIAYSHDKCIEYDYFKELNPIDKQYCMTRYAALENNDELIEYGNLQTSISDVYSNRVELVSDGEIQCKCYNGENYLVITNNNIDIESVEVDEVTKRYFNSKVRYINRGMRSENELVNVKLSSSEKLTMDDVTLTYIDKSALDFGDYVDPISEDRINIANNGIVIRPNNFDDECLCISIPKTRGWKAYVDSKEEEIYTCNDFFMGVIIPAGTELVELKYETPGLKIGAILSISFIIGFSIYLILTSKINRSSV